jgi:hypothetical protein
MWQARLLSGSVAALLVSIAAITQTDPDLWGNVRYGLDILEGRSLPSVDPYSFTQDRPWRNHEWLSEVIIAGAWILGGTAGLVLLKALLALGALYVVWAVYRGADLGWRMMASAAAIVVGAQLTHTLRPQLWSLLGVVLVAAQLQFRGPQRPWRLFALFLLWANAHGGFIVGLGMLSLWSAIESLRDRTQLKGWAIACASGYVATLFTPYGWHLWEFLLTTVRLTRPNIEDWQPVLEAGTAKLVLWSLIAAWTVCLLPILQKSRLAAAAVLIMLAVAAWRVVRIVPLFGVASVVLLAPAIVTRFPWRPVLSARPGEERVAVAIIMAVCLAGTLWVGRWSFTCINGDDDGMPDRSIVRALAPSARGHLVVYFNWGHYAIWHLSPAIKVSMDGRRETIYSDQRIREHDDILFGEATGFEVLKRWNAEYVWLPTSSSRTRQWLEANGYRIDIDAPGSYVAVRGDLPVVAWHRDGGSTRVCFPD